MVTYKRRFNPAPFLGDTLAVISFECPHCRLQTAVATEYAGKSGPCAGCGRTINIPDEPSPDSVDSRSMAGRRVSSQQLPRWMRVSLAIGGITLAILVGGSILNWLVRPALMAARADAHEQTCRINMQAIGAALHAYEAEHGELPPAYSVDENGKPLLSWRVLILPYLGPDAQSLYQQIDRKRPWNSPENSQWNPWSPDVFSCRADQPFATGDSSYLLVTDAAYAFFRDQQQSLDAIKDPLNETLLVVEVANSGVNWMEPRDITALQLASGISNQFVGLCCSRHSSGSVQGGFADGRVHDISSFSGRELDEMATIAGGEATRLPMIEDF